MKRWLSLLTIGILVIGFAVSLSLLFQTYARLDDANAEITDLKVAVSDLKSDLSEMATSNHLLKLDLLEATFAVEHAKTPYWEWSA